ncbi:MAG: hypothetical protein MUC79_16120 [Thiobacillaceae bacterium]|jgi:hypothetical protein|nr:hypothetical protein [Thiobacillaceae bacterium]
MTIPLTYPPPSLDLKRGDTLALDGQALTASAGPPLDLTDWTLRAQVRSLRGVLLTDLVVAVTDASEGRFTLTAAAGVTATWDPGTARMDIEYTDPTGVVQSTETLLVQVLPDETR